MGWNSTYLEWIKAGLYEPVFVLEFVDGTSYGAAAVGESYSVASHPDVFGSDATMIADQGIKVGSCSVTPGTWNYTAGSWSVQVCGSISALLQRVTRTPRSTFPFLVVD